MPLVRRLVPRRATARPAGVPSPESTLLLDLAADWYWATDAQLRFTVVQPTQRLRSQLTLPAPGQLPWESDTSSAASASSVARRAVFTTAALAGGDRPASP